MNNKKIVNLGKVKGRTLDIKIEDKILKKKYDDQAEWEDVAELTGGVDVVDNADKLPTAANENDIVFVENEAFVETVEYQEEVPIVLIGGEQVFNIEFRQDAKFIHESNLGELYPEVSDKENIISYDCIAYTPNSEISMSCFYYPPSLVSNFFGAEQSIDAYVVMQYNDDDSMSQYYKFRGISVKDFITNFIEFPGTEEQLEVLLGEHYSDKSEDNPSYDWIKVIMSEEPINDNSVFLDDAEAYFTLEYNATIDISGLLMFEAYELNVMKIRDDGDGDSILCIGGSVYEPDEDSDFDFEEVLKCGSVIVNMFISGGIKDIFYDIYKQKGFHIYEDGKWTSLEEKMNIPKIVNTYSDLPKSFIENGLMAVANEKVILPEPTYDIGISSQKVFEVNPTPSVKNELDKIKQYFIDNGAEVDWDNSYAYMESGFYSPVTGTWASFMIGPVFDDGYSGIVLRVSADEDITRHFVYSEEAGATIYIPDIGSPQEWGFTLKEGDCWYYYETEERGDYDYLVDIPKKFTEQDWFLVLDDEIMFEGLYIGYETEDNYGEVELTSYEFDNLFRFYDLNKTQIYPKGFYKYFNNRWYHQPNIAGASFDNEDVLKKITNEDIGNIELNTKARHEHYNKYYIDQIGWDFINKLNNDVPQNTNARHTHSNQYYLDQINSTKIDNIDKNTTARHTHSNKSVLDGITQNQVQHLEKLKNYSVSDSNNPSFNSRRITMETEYVHHYPSTGSDYVIDVFKSYSGSEEFDSIYHYIRENDCNSLTFTFSTYNSNRYNFKKANIVFGVKENPIKFQFQFSTSQVTWKNGYPEFYPNCLYELIIIQAYSSITIEWIQHTKTSLNYLDGGINKNYNYGYYSYDGTLKYANTYIKDGDTFIFNYREEDIITDYKPILGDDYPEYIDANTYIDYLNYIDFIYRKVSKISKNAQFLPEKFIITGDMDVDCLFQGRGNEPELAKILEEGIDLRDFTITTNMFRYCTFSGKMGELNTGGIIEAYYMFGGSAIEELPCIDLNNCQAFTGIFSSMNYLKTIKKIIFNGAASKINGIFNGTTTLENIVWEGNIEIDTNFTAFQYCKVLTIDSLISILQNLTNPSGSNYTVTIGAENIEKLNEYPDLINHLISLNLNLA